jgi:hypothetical protein
MLRQLAWVGPTDFTAGLGQRNEAMGQFRPSIVHTFSFFQNLLFI